MGNPFRENLYDLWPERRPSAHGLTVRKSRDKKTRGPKGPPKPATVDAFVETPVGAICAHCGHPRGSGQENHSRWKLILSTVATVGLSAASSTLQGVMTPRCWAWSPAECEARQKQQAEELALLEELRPVGA